MVIRVGYSQPRQTYPKPKENRGHLVVQVRQWRFHASMLLPLTCHSFTYHLSA